MMGYREGLTHIQLWLLNSLMQQTVFDIWNLLLSEMEDTIIEGFRVTGSCHMLTGLHS